MTTTTNAQSPMLPERQLGSYLVTKELGRNREGGRISYLASQPGEKKPVVLKQFRFAQMGSSWSGFKSYEREIEILQAIAHPQIPRYLDSFETADGFCMVQEYKAAPNLAARSHLMPGQVQQVAISILEILSDLQQQVPPVIHRDIKPENILVDDDLQAYLIDFGLARHNQDAIAASSVAAGTPGFMPPEELFNRPLDTSADLYSVGATLISLLTQVSSTRISELLDENYRFSFESYLPLVSPRFVQWLQTMVEPNPRNRFKDAATALTALKAINIQDMSEPLLETANGETPLTQRNINKRTVVLSITCLLAAIPLCFRFLPASNTTFQPTPRKTVFTAQDWFNEIKPYCNSLEVVTALQQNPHPKMPVGVGLGASCYALAGKFSLADSTIQSLPEEDRITAAQVLFEIGHPVADRGDDESAGPLMDLVLKYWPDNYMARYHAGMSAYVLAENDKAVKHLEEFLKVYTNNDVWRQKASLAIDNIQRGIPADERFKVHH